jgi:hypothetical protein
MNRELKFSLNVEENALLCPNPQEFYSKAYLTEDIVGNFRTLPGIKSETKLANVLFNQVLQASNCAFSASPAVLDAIDINVCPLSGMAEVCQFDLEQSFASIGMVKGSNNFEQNEFFTYFWSEMAAQIQEEITEIRWQGDTGITASTHLNLCNGYLVKFEADSEIIGLTATGDVDSSNVLARLTTVYTSIPAAVRRKKNDLRMYVAPNVAAAFRIAAATGNTMAYITKELDFTFLGVKIVEDGGLPDNVIVASLWSNLIYAFDGEADSKQLKIINLADTVAEPYMRARTNLKVGFHYTNPSEIVYYKSV